jgi:hypothetical protein
MFCQNRFLISGDDLNRLIFSKSSPKSSQENKKSSPIFDRRAGVERTVVSRSPAVMVIV